MDRSNCSGNSRRCRQERRTGDGTRRGVDLLHRGSTQSGSSIRDMGANTPALLLDSLQQQRGNCRGRPEEGRYCVLRANQERVHALYLHAATDEVCTSNVCHFLFELFAANSMLIISRLPTKRSSSATTKRSASTKCRKQTAMMPNKSANALMRRAIEVC